MKLTLLVMGLLSVSVVVCASDSAFKTACEKGIIAGKIVAMGDDLSSDTEQCNLPGGANTFTITTLNDLARSCRKVNAGVYPLNIGTQIDESNGLPFMTATCFGRLNKRLVD